MVAPVDIPVVELGFLDSIQYYRVVLVVLGDCIGFLITVVHLCLPDFFDRNRKSGMNKIRHHLAIWEQGGSSQPFEQDFCSLMRIMERVLTDGDLIALESFWICDLGGLGMGKVPMTSIGISKTPECEPCVKPTRYPRNRSGLLLKLAPDCREAKTQLKLPDSFADKDSQ